MRRGRKGEGGGGGIRALLCEVLGRGPVKNERNKTFLRGSSGRFFLKKETEKKIQEKNKKCKLVSQNKKWREPCAHDKITKQGWRRLGRIRGFVSPRDNSQDAAGVAQVHWFVRVFGSPPFSPHRRVLFVVVRGCCVCVWKKEKEEMVKGKWGVTTRRSRSVRRHEELCGGENHAHSSTVRRGVLTFFPRPLIF